MLLINPYRFGIQTKSPNEISGLQLWLDATTGLYDATSGGNLVTTDGSAVARWEDQSGNGFHATQGTLNNRPLLKTGVQNGKNAIRFDGTNDFLGLSGTGLNIVRNVSQFSVYVVMKFDSLPTAAQTIFCAFDNGTSRVRASLDVGSTSGKYRISGRRVDGSNLDSATGTIDASTNRILVRAEWNYGAAVAEAFENNALRVRDGAFQTAGSTSDTASGAIRIGTASILNYLKGDICEVCAFQSILSSSDKTALENHLSSKWGI